MVLGISGNCEDRRNYMDYEAAYMILRGIGGFPILRVSTYFEQYQLEGKK